MRLPQLTVAPVVRRDPTVAAIPLVCDSPHSGTYYPADFGYAVPHALLRQGEDTHVERLWQAAPDVGATLIQAGFPRAYIDPNRTLDDLDPDALQGQWPVALAPGEKTRLGKGLIWTRLDANTPIYDRKLSVDEVQHRLNAYYHPYHDALAQAVSERYQQFGCLWHLNLHSMPNDVYERLGIASSRPLADFVLGDRDGTTCEPGIIDVIERFLKDQGYSVALNDPYKGVQLIAQIGQPARKRYSLQIEIRRPVYMNEITREPTDDFVTVQADLTRLLGQIAAYIRSGLR